MEMDEKENLFGTEGGDGPFGTKRGEEGSESKKDSVFGESEFIVEDPPPKPAKVESVPVTKEENEEEGEKEKESNEGKGKEKETNLEEVSTNSEEDDKIYDISINETHTATEGDAASSSSYTVYHIELHTLSSSEPHVAYKRYRQFVAFHSELGKYFPSASLPSLPGRTLFGSPLDSEVVANRKVQLEKYLKELLVTHPDIFFSFHTRLFLGLYDLTDKVAIVTGASSGLGLETARGLATLGAHVIMACRSAEKTGPIVEQIKKETGNNNIEFIALDLGSLKSVRQFVGLFHARELPLHILVNNAGHLGGQAVTEDEFEGHMGVNYIGHFLLTHLLLEDLQSVSDTRIINVTATAYERATTINFDNSFIRAASPPSIALVLEAYEMSKLALVLFTHELSQRLKSSSVVVHVVNPAPAATQLWRNIPNALSWMMKRFMADAETSAKAILFCAVTPEAGEMTGRYFESCVERTPTLVSRNSELMARLWEESEKWVGLIEDQY